MYKRIVFWQTVALGFKLAVYFGIREYVKRNYVNHLDVIESTDYRRKN